MSAIQVTVSSGLDWPAVALDFVTLGLAIGTVYLARETRKSVDEIAKSAAAAQAEADATLALVAEARTDRELEVQPLLTLGAEQAVMPLRPGETNVPWLQVRNVGRGPALTVRIVQYLSGEMFWSEGRFLIPAGEQFPPASPTLNGGRPMLPLSDHRGISSVDPNFVGSDPDNIVAYCRDQLGNGLRFAVRTGEPPEVWHRGEPAKPWSAALEEPFDWRPVELRS